MSALNALPVGSELDDGGHRGRDALVRIAVQRTERGNRAILRLNQFRRQRRCDPAYFGAVSDDEAEEPMPVDPGLLVGGWGPTGPADTDVMVNSVPTTDIVIGPRPAVAQETPGSDPSAAVPERNTGTSDDGWRVERSDGEDVERGRGSVRRPIGPQGPCG